MDEKFINFNQLRREAIESPNKVAFMVNIFKILHDDAPPEDFKNLGGRLAGILKQANDDYCRVLQTIWKTSADNPVGSHLNYIQKGLMYNKNQWQRDKVDKERPRVKYEKAGCGENANR